MKVQIPSLVLLSLNVAMLTMLCSCRWLSIIIEGVGEGGMGGGGRDGNGGGILLCICSLLDIDKWSLDVCPATNKISVIYNVILIG